MQKKSTIAERIKALIDKLGMTTYQFAKEIGYERKEKIYNLVNGKTQPGWETIEDIIERFPELNGDWLLRGVGDMFKTEAVQITSATSSGPDIPQKEYSIDEYITGKNLRSVTVTVDKNGKDTILMVPIKAQAGYRSRYFDLEYEKELFSFTLPNFNSGTYRAFEVEGDSMQPTIRHADYVICSFVENWKYFKPGYVYVVVTHESVNVKRIPQRLNQDNEFTLHSDNTSYPPFILPAEEIREVWWVRGILTTQIPANSNEVQDRLIETIEILGKNTAHTESLIQQLISKVAVD